MKLNTAVLLIIGVLIGTLLLSSCASASLAVQPTPTEIPTQAPPAPTQPPEVPTPQPTPSGDVQVTELDAGKTVTVQVGQTLVVTLEGNLTTGYNWYAVAAENAVLEQVGEPVFSGDTSLLGSAGMISLVFRATAPGQQDLALNYERSFEKGVAPLKTFRITVVVEAPPAPETPQATQTVVVNPAGGWKGWPVYTNAAYGFSFQYPPNWKAEELQDPNSTLNGHAVWLVPDTDSNILLQIAFKRSNESITLGRTGVGSGDLIEDGKVMFLGQEVTRSVLVAQGKEYTVMYRQDSNKIQRGDLEFTLDLDYRGLYTDPTALTDGVEANADDIVASFQMK